MHGRTAVNSNVCGMRVDQLYASCGRCYWKMNKIRAVYLPRIIQSFLAELIIFTKHIIANVHFIIRSKGHLEVNCSSRVHGQNSSYVVSLLVLSLVKSETFILL